MASIPHITVLGSLNMDLVAYVPHRTHPLRFTQVLSTHRLNIVTYMLRVFACF